MKDHFTWLVVGVVLLFLLWQNGTVAAATTPPNTGAGGPLALNPATSTPGAPVGPGNSAVSVVNTLALPTPGMVQT